MSVTIASPRGTRETMINHKVIYRTLDLSTGRCGVAPAKEVEEILKKYKEKLAHKSSAANFGDVEVIFKNVEAVKEMAGKKLISNI